jgi:hypothetical protein
MGGGGVGKEVSKKNLLWFCPKVLPPFLTSNRWVGQGGGDTPTLLKRNFYFGELPKFQFVLGDGPIKKMAHHYKNYLY